MQAILRSAVNYRGVDDESKPGALYCAAYEHVLPLVEELERVKFERDDLGVSHATEHEMRVSLQHERDAARAERDGWCNAVREAFGHDGDAPMQPSDVGPLVDAARAEAEALRDDLRGVLARWGGCVINKIESEGGEWTRAERVRSLLYELREVAEYKPAQEPAS